MYEYLQSCLTWQSQRISGPYLIYQNSNVALRLSGQMAYLLSFFNCPSMPKRDLDTKKTPPNVEVCPESHVRILILILNMA